MAKTITSLTKHVDKISILTSDFTNSLYGGLYNSADSISIPTTDPLISGHLHDGQHIDGHAQKIDLVDHITGELAGDNLGNNIVTSGNISTTTVQGSAIPESEIIMGTTYYNLDLSNTSYIIDALFEKKAGYQWGHSDASEDIDGFIPSGFGIINFCGVGGRTAAFPGGDGSGISSDGKYIIAEADDGANQQAGWQGSARLAAGSALPITQGELLPRLSIKMSISSLTDARYFVGFNDDPTTISGGDDPNKNYVAFQFSGANLRGDTTWQVVHNIFGGTQAKIDTGITAVANTVLNFEIKYLTSTSVRFSISDHTYTNELYGATITVQPAGTLEWKLIQAVGDWEGVGIQEMLRFYKAIIVNKCRSEA